MKKAYFVPSSFLCTKSLGFAGTMSSAQKFAVQFRNDVITAKPLISPERRFGLLSIQAVNLFAVSKEASTIGLLKNKDWSTLATKIRKISTPAKLEIRLKNDERDVRRLRGLRVALNSHKPKAKNLPDKINVANVGMLGIMLQLAKNKGRTSNYHRHPNNHHHHHHDYYAYAANIDQRRHLLNIIRRIHVQRTFSQASTFVGNNLVLYFPYLLVLFILLALFTLLVLSTRDQIKVSEIINLQKDFSS